MAPARKRSVCPEATSGDRAKSSKLDMSGEVQQIIESRRHANDVFDILERVQSEEEGDAVGAINACGTVFSTLMAKRALFNGKLHEEDEMLSGEYSAEEKYSMFMRHRYNDCLGLLLDALSHESYNVMDTALCTLMKFAAVEGRYPLQELDWSEHFSFPRKLIKEVVTRLLSTTEDTTLLISRFQEYLEMDDVRYYVMSSVRKNEGQVMNKIKEETMHIYQNNVFTLLSNINMPSEESEMSNFMVKQEENHKDWKAANLNEHKRTFEKMWLGFLKHKLPSNMYKKILVVLHESILPHMSKPTLMIGFLTAAYEVGGAISLLALNGLFVLIHQHNLDYPDFYKKLYNLLEPSIFHVKYRARFFHLANLFLSSTHLPVYLVAAFAKRLARLALGAPPESLLMVLPFIYNLIRRHPSCRVLIHRPSALNELCEDPYVMDEEDPAHCRALESSLWEIKTLQNHYHPNVVKEAMKINTPLSAQEDDINDLLEMTSFELVERDLKDTHTKGFPLEFEPATKLLQGGGQLLGQHFSL